MITHHLIFERMRKMYSPKINQRATYTGSVSAWKADEEAYDLPCQ